MYFTQINNDITNNKLTLDTVIERYVGRRPELIKIEAEIEKLIQKIKDGYYSVIKSDAGDGTLKQKQINESPENKKIETLFKQLFKLKNFDLEWWYTVNPNAMTPTKSFQILDNSYKVDKDGVDYNEKLNVMVVITTGTVTHLNMTAPEIVALILHEIGHNFYQSIFQILKSVSVKNMTDSLLHLIVSDVTGIANIVLKGFTFFEDVIDKLKLRKLKLLIEEGGAVMSTFTPKSVRGFTILLKEAISRPDVLLSRITPKVVFLYSVEKHADSFAVDYGYGVHLASALNKLDRRVDNVAYDIPVYNVLMDFDALVHDIVIQTLSGYPTVHNRQRTALERVKSAKNDPDLPPHLRKQLDEQIKEFEEYYEHYMSMDNDENKKRIFTWTYRSMVDKMFGGNVDLREIFHKMDSEYNKKWGDVKK